MVIRLLQEITDIKLVQAEANPEAVPPPGWADSKLSSGKDCVLIRNHLTMYIEVSVSAIVFAVQRCSRCCCATIGRLMGRDETHTGRLGKCLNSA